MPAILDSIAQQNFDRKNPFALEAQRTFFAEEINKNRNTPKENIAAYFMAVTLYKLGREKEAIEIFDHLDSLRNLHLMTLPPEFEETYALANLRYGERVNCIQHHMPTSCIYPIKSSGVHKDETGSRKAIAAYQAILKKDPEDLSSRWLLNIAYMTLNEYPSKVPRDLLIPGLDQPEENIDVKPFEDLAPSLNFDVSNRSGGVVIDDFNNDGYLDVVTSDWDIQEGVMHFFKNNADGSFTDIAKTAGLSATRGGLNMIQADYNNDGFTDILVLRGAWLPGKYGKQPNSLLRNNGNGTFTDVTIESGLLSFHPTQAGVWRDFNNDGWLDLFIGNETTNDADPQGTEFYQNNGDGTFTNITETSGCAINAMIKGTAAADYDNDGLQDIYISTCSGKRFLLKNETGADGKIYFKEMTAAAGLNDININTFITWFWDYDNDGWSDIFVCGFDPGSKSIAYATAAEALHKPYSESTKMYLYHNNGNGSFTNVSKEANLDKAVFAMGSNFGDFNNDGYLDMYLGTGNPDYKSAVPNRLFQNLGGKRFADVTNAARVGIIQKGHAVSFADLDNDGWQDIFEEVGGAYTGDAYYDAFYHNPGQNNNHWIKLQLQGKKSNRSAIGARLKLTFKDGNASRVVYRDVNSGGSFGCSPLRREIGIGMADIVDEMTISWPGDKTVQTFKNIRSGQCLKITQGENQPVAVPLKILQFTDKHVVAVK